MTKEKINTNKVIKEPGDDETDTKSTGKGPAPK